MGSYCGAYVFCLTVKYYNTPIYQALLQGMSDKTKRASFTRIKIICDSCPWVVCYSLPMLQMF